jgi:hypothetical protein
MWQKTLVGNDTHPTRARLKRVGNYSKNNCNILFVNFDLLGQSADQCLSCMLVCLGKVVFNMS